MISLKSIEALISNLKERISEYPDTYEYNMGYKDALNDCLYDIKLAMDDSINQEMLETMPTEDLLHLIDEQIMIANAY